MKNAIKPALSWLASAFVFWCICLMVSAISFVVILGAMQMRKERVRLDYIHQYYIDKMVKNLKGMEMP